VFGVLEVEAAAGHPPVVAYWPASLSRLEQAYSRSKRLRSISPWVWLRSGDRLRVQLMYNARRSSKRHSPGSLLTCSVIEPPGVGEFSRG